MIREFREKQGRTIEEAARGLLSAAELSRVENGTKEIEYLIMEALFETYGKSLDKLEIVVSSDEYRILELRDRICEALLQKRSADAEELIRQYKDITDEEKLIHRQYIQMAEAISNYNKAGKLTAVLQQLKTSLHLTTAEIKGQNIHLFHQEIYLIYMIFWMQYQCGDTERLLDNARKVEQYICEQYTDEEEKVKIYPQCIWLLGRILLDIQYDKTAKYTINKGIDCLTENGALHWLTQLLELKKECEERLGEKAEAEECDRYLDAIRTLYEVAGERQTKEISLALFMQSSTQRECIISNYFLKNLREEKGVTQYEMSEDICAWETVSRIESGRTPNQKKLYRLWKKLGIERERYYGFIESEHYEVYGWVRDYNRLIGNEKRQEAEMLFERIESELDKKIPVNKQYLERARITEKLRNGRISNEEAIEELRKILAITMPPLPSGKRIYRIPFRTEFAIMNQIARTFAAMGKYDSACEIYAEVLKQYHKNESTLRGHVVQGILLYVCYAAILEDNNELELSEQIAKEGMKFTIECMRGDTACKILANLTCVYEKRKEIELEMRYLKDAYYLSRLYRQGMLTDLLKNRYAEKQINFQANRLNLQIFISETN